MNNKSVSDFVAATMDAVLKSQEHNSLFNTTYKFASDENSAETMEGSDEDSCSADDDDDAKMTDTSCADDVEDDNDAETMEVSEEDTSDADDLNAGLYDVSANYDVAIDSLLTASAALDSVGLEKSSTVSLKLASLVLEAKKKETSKETAKSKDTKGKKDSSAKSKKDTKKTDSNAAKDKSGKSTKKPTSSKPAVTSTTKPKPKGKDDKSGKSGKSGKTNPFAKKSK